MSQNDKSKFMVPVYAPYASIINNNVKKLDYDILENISNNYYKSVVEVILSLFEVNEEKDVFYKIEKEYKSSMLQAELLLFKDSFELNIYRTDYAFIGSNKIRKPRLCLYEYKLDKTMLEYNEGGGYFECLEYIMPDMYDLCVVLITEKRK
jgi:hypothetical protein